MNTNQSSKKNLIIIVVIIAIAAVAMFYFLGSKKSSDTNSLVESTTAERTQAGRHVLALLNQIQRLEIDPSIFDEKTALGAVFATLQDYTVEIPELPVGRANPFAPIPGEVIKSTR